MSSASRRSSLKLFKLVTAKGKCHGMGGQISVNRLTSCENGTLLKSFKNNIRWPSLVDVLRLYDFSKDNDGKTVTCRMSKQLPWPTEVH